MTQIGTRALSAHLWNLAQRVENMAPLPPEIAVHRRGRVVKRLREAAKSIPSDEFSETIRRQADLLFCQGPDYTKIAKAIRLIAGKL